MDKNFYKNSLNIFSTDFSMKANLPQKDKFFTEFWKNEDIYQKLLKKNINNPRFILHDGLLMQTVIFILAMLLIKF